MLRYFTGYVCTAAILFPLDMVWIGYLAKDMYRAGLGPIMLERPNIPAAVLFYVVYIVGLTVFAVGPALANGSWRTAVIFGAAFGFFAYATYDLTNLATLQHFPARMAFIDMAWGTAVSAGSAAGGFWIARLVLEKLQAAG